MRIVLEIVMRIVLEVFAVSLRGKRQFRRCWC